MVNLCHPCHRYITTGDGNTSQAYRNAVEQQDHNSPFQRYLNEVITQSSFGDAINSIATFENERAVAQAVEWSKTGIRTGSSGGAWDTCFAYCFRRLVEAWDEKYKTNIQDIFYGAPAFECYKRKE